MLPEDVLRDAPAYTPRPHELADLELLLSGAYAPLTGFPGRPHPTPPPRPGRPPAAPPGFPGRADLTALRRAGRPADGTQWPVPVTCEIPAEMAAGLDLADPR